jgi:transposase-like protein
VSEKRLPQTLVEAIRYFDDPDVCTDFVAKLRWSDGPVCPSCEGRSHSYLTTRRLWKCKTCKRQFSVKVGTIFEDSPLPLDKWLTSIWLIANSKNGISSYELHRAIGITQKSAWFVLHRVRLAMKIGNFEKFDGEVEVDETFVGGKARNMHKHVREQKITGTGGKDKTVIVGALRRQSSVEVTQVRAGVVGNTRRRTLHAHIRDHVADDSAIYTDALRSYSGLEPDYDHATIDHAEKYVEGRVHTNGIENFWALLKRGLKGTYVQVDPAHLFRYVDERVFTFNERDKNDLGRFVTVLAAVSGRRLTYAELTA